MEFDLSWFLISVEDCARCGRFHSDLKCVKFKNGPYVEHDGTVNSHWTTCPVTGDPIIVEMKEAEAELENTPLYEENEHDAE